MNCECYLSVEDIRKAEHSKPCFTLAEYLLRLFLYLSTH